MPKYAEDANYFDTEVSPSKSMGEIGELLTDFGAVKQVISQGQAGGRFAWLVRFEWQGRSYRFMFTPLECRFPTRVRKVGGKNRTGEEQSRAQMGRVAYWFVKAILTAAETHPHALFGFLELPGASNGGLPLTAGELDVSGLTDALPALDVLRQLQSGEGE